MIKQASHYVWSRFVALLIGATVLYVVLFWPACSLVGRGVLPVQPTASVYHPMLTLCWGGAHGRVADAIVSYVSLDLYGIWGLLSMGESLGFPKYTIHASVL
jgi:hypothetical protein